MMKDVIRPPDGAVVRRFAAALSPPWIAWFVLCSVGLTLVTILPGWAELPDPLASWEAWAVYALVLSPAVGAWLAGYESRVPEERRWVLDVGAFVVAFAILAWGLIALVSSQDLEHGTRALLGGSAVQWEVSAMVLSPVIGVLSPVIGAWLGGCAGQVPRWVSATALSGASAFLAFFCWGAGLSDCSGTGTGCTAPNEVICDFGFTALLVDLFVVGPVLWGAMIGARSAAPRARAAVWAAAVCYLLAARPAVASALDSITYVAWSAFQCGGLGA